MTGKEWVNGCGKTRLRTMDSVFCRLITVTISRHLLKISAGKFSKAWRAVSKILILHEYLSLMTSRTYRPKRPVPVEVALLLRSDKNHIFLQKWDLIFSE